MKRKITACFLGLLLTALSLFAGCRDAGAGQGFRFPLESEPSQLDPQIAVDASSVTVLSSLFEGLTRLDDEGNPIPGAADWTVSDDGLTYTFTLKESYWSTCRLKDEDNLWKDPVMVTAGDFVFGMQRAIQPATASPSYGELLNIVNAKEIHDGLRSADTLGVHATDDTHLTISLVTADASFPAKLSTAPFMPCSPEFFAFARGHYGLEKDYLISNGAFYLQSWEHRSNLLLKPNENYHDAGEITPGGVRFVIGGENTLSALEEGDMDVVALTPEEWAQAQEDGIPTVELQDTVRSLYMNTADSVLGNASVRLALRDSVEWDSLYAYLEQLGEIPATGFVPPDGVVNGSDRFRRDDNAHRLSPQVASAQENWNAGLTALGLTKAPSLTLAACEEDGCANMARYLIQSWEKNLGIRCSLSLMSEDALAAAVKNGNYRLAIFSVIPTGLTGAEHLSAYTSAGAGNLCSFADGNYDNLCANALHGGRQALTVCENALYSSCPAVPLSFISRYYAVGKGVSGVTVRPFFGGMYGSPFSFRQARKKG